MTTAAKEESYVGWWQTKDEKGKTSGTLQSGGKSLSAQLGLRQGAGVAPTTSNTFDTGGKILKPPDLFQPSTIEEELSQCCDWSFAFKNFRLFMDDAFVTELPAESRKQRVYTD